jgi:hypothetical protein
MTPALIFTQDQINEFQRTEAQFMRDVLGLDDALVTDLSDLSDFAYSGMPAGALDVSRPQKELVATWDAWVIARVQKLYGITLTTTVVNLVCLFNQIEVSKRALVH